MEETMHVLFTCPFSRAVWMIIPGGSGILAGVHSNIATVFESWMNAVRQKSRSESWLKLAMTVSWSIWNERCEVQFQKKKANPVEVARKAMSFASYLDGLYKKQQDRVVARLPKTNTLHWKPPVSPFYVINCDASYDKNTKLTGIALVLRDFAGNWWGCSAKCYAGVKDSEQMECLAFSEAVKWSKALQDAHVVLETDLQGIESYIVKKAPVIAWENEDILIDAIDSLKSIPHWMCHFVPRSCNKPADKLAKFSRKYRVNRVWLDKPPDIIESLLIADTVISFG
ncbi:uncharacterized protein LOC113341753 [Papaver somniferum]|uniref:uncharacterized protein LOC113341753 n=1 Tax=Papaver somniferum TaxID=3469 RepID=UPI000E704074|nr:uncharacterized protein LOC113341753 [Papaver somniferum]